MKFSITTTGSIEGIIRKIEGFALPLCDSLAQQQHSNLSLRMRGGIGTDDRPMPALSPKYKIHKRRKGGRPLRDINLSGKTIGAIKLYKPTGGTKHKFQIRIGFSGQRANIIAKANQERAHFFGISKDDRRILTDRAKQLLRDFLNKK